MKKISTILIFFILPLNALFSLSFFEQGEELFMNNKPAEALVMLEAALTGDDSAGNAEKEKLYLYLGIIYEQLGQYEKAVDVLKLGLEASPKAKDKLYFNLGNNLFKLEDLSGAEAAYTDLLAGYPAFADAYLNRANVRIKTGKLKEAADDYSRFLTLKPSTPQKANIEKVIGLIRQSLAEAERARAEAERQRKEEEQRKADEEKKRIEEEKRKAEEAEKQRIEEEKRKAEEAKKQAEEERLRAEEERLRNEAAQKKAEEDRKKAEEEKKRQEALLKEVMESLKNASIETKNKKAASEDIQTYDFNLDLKD